ncbi:MAG: hypothetical protein N3E36_06945 [Sulfolobales archaeon]|nr:hypothetical protein [Ignisphaera sp.]MCX8199731.1 hypothetical protein [Sulfolobales archaeon]MDW8086114.1 hypothetical protein [Ignisphaera sp.]
MAGNSIRFLELKKGVIDPYNTYIYSYLTHKAAFLRLRSAHLLSHPLIIYSYNGFPFVSSAPFIYKYKELVHAYNTIMDQYMLDPLRLGCIDCMAYPLNTFSSIIISSMNIPLGVVSSCIDRGLELRSVDRASTPIDVYPVGFDNRVIFLNNDRVIYKTVMRNGDADFLEYGRCKSLLSLKHSHYKALLCLSDADTYITISDGVYGIEFPVKLNVNALEPFETVFYLYLNIAYIKLSNIGIVAYCDSGFCKSMELNGSFRPLALLSSNSMLGFMGNYLALYSVDEGKERYLACIRPEDIYNISVDPYRNFVLLSTAENLYLLDLNELSLISIPSRKRALGYVSDNYIVLLRGGTIDIFFIESGNGIHVERTLSSRSYIVRCSSIGKGVIACIDRAGRLVFINLKYIDLYINQHPRLLRDDPTTISISITDSAPYNLLKFEGYRELPYNIYRVDSSKSIISIAADSRFNSNKPTFSLCIQGLLKEHRVFIDSSNGIRIHSGKPSKILLPEVYVINTPFSRILIPNISPDLEGRLVLLIKDGELIKGTIRDGIIKFDKDIKISVNDSIYIVERFHDVIIGWTIRPLSIDSINLDSIVKIISSLESDGVKVCMDAHSLRNSVRISNIEVVCSDRVIRSNEGCVDISACKDILVILVEVVLGSSKEAVTTIPIQYDKKFSIEFVEGIDAHFSKVLYPKVRIPSRCAHFNDAHLYYDDSLKMSVKIVNRCIDLPVYLILPSSPHSIEPAKTFKLTLPFSLDDIVKGCTNFIVIEPSGIKFVYINVPLKNVIAYSHRIALKVATLLGIRSSAQKYGYGSSSA